MTGFMLTLLACNLGTSSNAPPTLAPLPTFTPQATLGYAAVRPVTVAEIEITPAPPTLEILPDLLDLVESDRPDVACAQLAGVRHPSYRLYAALRR